MRLCRILCAALLCATLGAPAYARETPDYIRLHVVANSDSALDQAAKLEARDEIRACSVTLLEGCESADEAYWLLAANADALREAAARVWDGEIRVETGEFDFPDKVYGGVLVPAGRYRAVRVVLGAGEGHNWWCVLYPTMCLPDEMPEDGQVRFYSGLGRWLRQLFGGEVAV